MHASAGVFGMTSSNLVFEVRSQLHLALQECASCRQEYMQVPEWLSELEYF